MGMGKELNIIGYATIKTGNWDVHFEKLLLSDIEGTTKEIVKPTIVKNATVINSFSVMFQNPFDKISYEVDIVNDGNLDAQITTLIISNPECKIKDLSSEDYNFCQNIKYSLCYIDGTKLKVGDVLKNNSSQRVRLELAYNSSMLPKNEIEIENLEITIIYSQY